MEQQHAVTALGGTKEGSPGCSPTRRGVVLRTPSGGWVDAALGWQAVGRTARPPLLLWWLLDVAWAAVGTRGRPGQVRTAVGAPLGVAVMWRARATA